jgi:type I site-specific restriction endonuclease
MPPSPEAQARQQIDAQLTAAGWAVQDYKEHNPSAARNKNNIRHGCVEESLVLWN